MNLLKLTDINTTGSPEGGYEFFTKRAVQEFLSWICIPEEVKMVMIDYTVGSSQITVAFTLQKERETDVRYTLTFTVDDSKIADQETQYYYIHNFKLNDHQVSLERLLGKGFISITEISDNIGNTSNPSDYADFITLIVEPKAFILDTFSN